MPDQSNIRRWLWVYLMLGATFLFGTDLFSAENTRPIIRWILSWIIPGNASSMAFGSGEGWVRKSAHFCEYALLALCWYRALRGKSPWNWKQVYLAWVWTTLWASVDEFQQGFISNHRTGNVWDVVLDSTGSATALLIICLLNLRERKSL